MTRTTLTYLVLWHRVLCKYQIYRNINTPVTSSSWPVPCVILWNGSVLLIWTENCDETEVKENETTL